MNEHLMQKEKAANEKSESNHYQFHAISLTSFSNISSIPTSTRMKWKKHFLPFFEFNNSYFAYFPSLYVYMLPGVSPGGGVWGSISSFDG